jgi:hypothetical protein
VGGEAEIIATRHSAFIRLWRKNWEYNGTVHHYFTDFKKACDLGEKYCNILIEFGIPMKIVELIEMCINKSLYR